MHPKDADGMATSVDPDQTASSEAVWSWSALFAETYLSQYIEFLRYYKNNSVQRLFYKAKTDWEAVQIVIKLFDWLGSALTGLVHSLV